MSNQAVSGPDDPDPAGPPAKKYNAFISYRHEGNHAVAKALQQGLQKMAKPWNKRRALEIFRDETGLSADPSLWNKICAAMDGSDWLIYLASPESRQSRWVGRELERWIQNKGPHRIMIALTAGAWRWDATGRLDVTSDDSAAHPALDGYVTNETKYIDISWARTDDSLTLRNARFRDAIADLAAPLHGVPKDELEGEDVRQQRRTHRLVRGAVSTLAGLTVAALVASVIAVENSREAQRQRDEAEAQARISTSQRLAQLSLENKGEDGSLGYLLAARAYRTAPTAAALGALFDWTQIRSDDSAAQARNNGGVSGRLVGHQGAIAGADFSPDGSLIATADARGVRITARTGGLAVRQLKVSDGVKDVAWTKDGLHAVSRGTLLLLDPETGAEPRNVTPVVAGRPLNATSLDQGPDGSLVVGTADGRVALVSKNSPVGVIDVGQQSILRVIAAREATRAVAISSSGAVIVDTAKRSVISEVLANDRKRGPGIVTDMSDDGSAIILMPSSSSFKVGTGTDTASVGARVLNADSGTELWPVRLREPYGPRDAVFLGGAARVLLGTTSGVDGAPGLLFEASRSDTGPSGGSAFNPPDTVSSINLSRDGVVLIADDDGGALVQSGPVRSPAAVLSPLSATDNGNSVVVAQGGKVGLMDVDTLTVRTLADAAGGTVSPDGSSFLTADGRLFDVGSGKERGSGLPPLTGAAAWSKDSGLAVYAVYGPAAPSIAVLDLKTARARTVVLAKGNARAWTLKGASISAANDRAGVVIRDSTAGFAERDRLFVVHTGEPKVVLTKDLKEAGGIRYTGEPERLVVGQGEGAVAYDPRTLTAANKGAYAPIGGNWHPSPDGATFLSTTEQCALLLVDGVSYQAIASMDVTIDEYESGCDASAAAWIDGGKRLVLASRSSGVDEVTWRTVSLDPALLLSSACRLAGRDLSTAEWEQFLPGTRKEPTCAVPVAPAGSATAGSTPGPGTPGPTAPSTGAVPSSGTEQASATPTQSPEETVPAAVGASPRGTDPLDALAGEFDQEVPQCQGAGVQPETCLGIRSETPDRVVAGLVNGMDFISFYLIERAGGSWKVVDRYIPSDEPGESKPQPDWLT